LNFESHKEFWVGQKKERMECKANAY